MGPSRINCISCNFCIASSSYAGLTWYPYFFLQLGVKGAWVGARTGSEGQAGAPASGEGAQGVSSFRETHLGGRFQWVLWDLAANLTACWSSREHCSPMPLPGGHPFLSSRLARIPLMKPGTMQWPHRTHPWGLVWFQGNLEQQPEDSNFLLHSGNEITWHFVPSC